MDIYGIIYKATNLINQKVYIGQTIRSLEKRKNQHLKNAINGKKLSYFHDAIKKHGLENFKWEIIAECSSKEELNSAEIGAIFINKSFGEDGEHFDTKFGYNMTPGGNSLGVHNLGRKQSQETIDKRVKHLRGKHLSEEHKQKLSNSNKGKKRSIETCKKVSDSRTGKDPWNKGKTDIYSEETLIKMRKPKTEETKIKVSNTLKEYFKNHDHPMKGKSQPKEYVEKMKKTKRERKAEVGKKNPNCKNLDVDLILSLYQSGKTIKEIAEQLNVKRGCISRRIDNPEDYK